MSESPRVNTTDSNWKPVWIWSWNVKRSYATELTECVLCCMRAKSVGCKKFFGISKKLKLFRRDNELSASPHGTNRTVAVQSYNTTWCLDSPPYSPAMTSSVMHYHIRFHHESTGWKWWLLRDESGGCNQLTNMQTIHSSQRWDSKYSEIESPDWKMCQLKYSLLRKAGMSHIVRTWNLLSLEFAFTRICFKLYEIVYKLANNDGGTKYEFLCIISNKQA